MKFVVAQVAPELCLTKELFYEKVDKKIANIIEQTGNVDLIILPEDLGLWMCLMEPTTFINKIFNKFLHKYNPIVTLSEESFNYNQDEILINLQFARPGSILFDKNISTNEIIQKRSKIAKWFANFADWLFSKINLRFIAQYLRSNEITSTYKYTFSKIAKKYNIYIQAGSIYEKVIGGTKGIAYAFSPEGNIVCKQEKWNPIPFEGMLGIKNGSGYETFEVNGIKCGIAICADLNFKDNLVTKLASEGCKLISSPSGGIVPSHSWKFDYQVDVEEAQQARANENNVIIGRSYNAGDLLNGLLKFQGLSTIVEPNRLVSIVPEDKIVSEYNLIYEI